MFIFYDTRSLTETAWFWKCAKTQMTIHFAKDSRSVRQMPKAGVIVDVITMKICVLPCIIRIQSRPSGRSPICRHGKYKDFVGVVSKTGTFLKPTQQWNFSFFLFSAKRGGTSPNVQGRLSCWLINQKMSPLGWIFPPFTKYLDACIIRLTEICWWESGWRYDVTHVQIFSVPHHGSLSCGSCARSHVVIIYTWRDATKMATKGYRFSDYKSPL